MCLDATLLLIFKATEEVNYDRDYWSRKLAIKYLIVFSDLQLLRNISDIFLGDRFEALLQVYYSLKQFYCAPIR